jgi:hypothetical protein
MTEQNTRFLSGPKISFADMVLICSTQLAAEIHFHPKNILYLPRYTDGTEKCSTSPRLPN